MQNANLTRGQAEEQLEDDEAVAEAGNESSAKAGNNFSEDEEPLPSARASRPSRWAAYESKVVRAERRQPYPGQGFASASSLGGQSGNSESEDLESGFVTSLPDTYAQRPGKRKRSSHGRARKRNRSPEMTNRNVGERSDNDEGLNLSSSRLGFDQNMRQSDQPSGRNGSRRKSNRWAGFERDADIAEESNRWRRAVPSPRFSDTRFSTSDGVFTCLGEDEIVEEDVRF